MTSKGNQGRSKWLVGDHVLMNELEYDPSLTAFRDYTLIIVQLQGHGQVIAL